ncbi:hypothetical protein BACCAP_03555 [Pseudoflavonifractor capillosus ATCC 29799]|uniref:Uncharacterized protein n=1 Tax=Pseudoflavonifractor capillosus ATCC 29799 TaxID=411467 RepID=A6NZA4_9FIRM|nr:hypothetical protein BACCAP_03555 [Pseudoflavonifractor capillosus ATCC 29799]
MRVPFHPQKIIFSVFRRKKALRSPEGRNAFVLSHCFEYKHFRACCQSAKLSAFFVKCPKFPFLLTRTPVRCLGPDCRAHILTHSLFYTGKEF